MVFLKSTPNGDGGVFQYGVAEDSEIRLENFRKLVGPEDKFSPNDVASMMGWGRASYWSDLFYGRKSFGEKVARKIETSLFLVRLTLDDPEGARKMALSSEVLSALDAADVEKKSQADALLRVLLGLSSSSSGKEDAAA